jgi:SAM-dependent methyltransferase
VAAALFKDLELEGWTRKAAAYDDWFAPITRQAIGPLLDALADNFTGKRFLDICTGTGHLAAAAAVRGARAEGLDFAEAMVEIAAKNYPHIAFRLADAERLPFADGCFELVANAFGIWHLGDPVCGLREVFRVLAPSGRFAFSTWLPPERGFDLLRIIMHAIRKHGTLDVGLPPVPPPFRFAECSECDSVLRAIGFTNVSAAEQVCTWTGRDGGELLDLMDKSLVRVPMLIDHQTAEARERIRMEIVEAAEEFRRGNRIVVAFPYLLVTATRPI